MQTFHLFCIKKLLFLFYTLIFTKHSHQFIYSTHLSNKIFIILQFFIILSLTASLSLSLTNPIRNSFNHLSLPHRLSLSQTQSDSPSLSHEPNNNYNPPFHNKITTKHPNNIPFLLSQIFSLTKHFPRFSHKPNNSDLRQIKQNFLKSSHLHHHHHHHTNHHERLRQISQPTRSSPFPRRTDPFKTH